MKKYIFTILFSFLVLSTSAYASTISSTSFSASDCGSVAVTITGDDVTRVYDLNAPSNYYLTHYTGATGYLCDNGDFRYRATNTPVTSADLPQGDYSLVIMNPYTGECYDGLSYSACKASPDFDSEILFTVTAPASPLPPFADSLATSVDSISSSAVDYAPNVFAIFGGLVGLGVVFTAFRRTVGNKL